jgi:hypothetical protein
MRQISAKSATGLRLLGEGVRPSHCKNSWEPRMLAIVILAVGALIAVYPGWNLVHFFLEAYQDRPPEKRKKAAG